MEQDMLKKMYGSLGISAQVLAFAEETEKNLKERFAAIDRTAEYNQLKVVRAMQGEPGQRHPFRGHHRIWVQ